MVNKNTISINPLCEFLSASERRKQTIIKNVKKPKTMMIAPYPTARSRIVRFFKNNFKEEEIISGIDHLQYKKGCDTPFKIRDRENSIEALRKFLRIQFPQDFQKIKCTFSKERSKEIDFNDIIIRVSPDIIIRWEEDGQKFIGGIKFHISKGNIFDYQTSSFAAGLVQLFLEEKIATEDEIVVGSHCLSIDIFGERTCSAPLNKEEFIKKLTATCKEISVLWEVA